MREILFRGKRENNGEWKYGSYVYQYGCHEILLESCEGEYGFDHYSVKPETVGQFTGLLDKNGTKIFEGDILECPSGMEERCEVIYNPYCAAFQLMCKDGYSDFFLCSIDHSKMEVIGNIHDNPEPPKEDAE